MKSIEGLTKEHKQLIIAMLEASNPKLENTVGDIRKIDKICKVLESDADELEDTDHGFLKNRVAKFPGWVGAGRKEIIKIADILGIE